MHNASHLVLSNYQVWAALIGAIVPLGAYFINTFIPGASEAVKAFVHVILAAIVGGLYTALDTNVFGFNASTLQLVFSAVVAALVAHHVLWKPADVNNRVKATR